MSTCRLYLRSALPASSIQVYRPDASSLGEVNQINFIIKKHACRYIAAAKEEWLYPEPRNPSGHWRQLDDQYFLVPAPRSVTFPEEIILGYNNRPADFPRAVQRT